MKPIMKKICIILLASQFLACTDPAPEAEPETNTPVNILGTWKFRKSIEEVSTPDTTYKGFAAAKISFYPPYSLTFRENGTGESDGTAFSYVRKGDTLSVTVAGKTARYLIAGGDADEIKLDLSKEGLSGVIENTAVFTALSLKTTYRNLEKINPNDRTYRVCSSTLTSYGTNGNSSTVKSEYTYNDEGKVASVTQISAPGTPQETRGMTTTYTIDHRYAGLNLFRVNQTYIGNGNVERSNFIDMDEAFRIIYVSTVGPGVKTPVYTSYKYDQDGQLIVKRQEEYAWTSPKRPHENEIYEYNHNGNLARLYREGERNGTVTPKYLNLEYTYTDFPVKVDIPFIFNYGTKKANAYYPKERKDYNSDGTLADAWRQEKYEYEFDSLGRILKKSVFDGASTLKNVTTYEYGCN